MIFFIEVLKNEILIIWSINFVKKEGFDKMYKYYGVLFNYIDIYDIVFVGWGLLIN